MLDLAAILRLTPLAATALKRHRRSDPAKSLDRLIRAGFEDDPSLGPSTTDSLITQWLYLHDDPRGAVIIAGLLETGDAVWFDALRVRAAEILDGLETLPWDVSTTVDRLIAAVRNNFVAAQKSAELASQRGTSALLSRLDLAATSADVQRVDDRIERLRRSIAPPQPRVLLVVSSFDENQQRHLARLNEHDQAAAARLGQLLDAAAISGLAGLVHSPPPWASREPAPFWRAMSRILIDAGRLGDAERALLIEADCVDVADRVEAFIFAALCAESDGRRQDADGHVQEAAAVSPEHPWVLLFAASRAESPSERLALTEAVIPATEAQVARKQAQRALALLALQRFDEAVDAARASHEADPHGAGQEIATLGTIVRAHSRLPLGDRDDRPLMDAVQYQLSTRREALATGRLAMAGLAGARAALGTAVLGDRGAAGELIDQVASGVDELENDEARSTLIEAALGISDVDRARRLLPEPDGTVDTRLQYAAVAVLGGDDRAAAVAELDKLILDLNPGPQRTNAVVLRLLAANDPSTEFEPALVEGIADADRLLAHTRAARAVAANDLSAARSVLSAFDDPASLSLRVGIAEADGKLPEAIGLQAALTRSQRTAENLFRLASLRSSAGDFPGAIRDALRLATDERKLTSARDAAYRLAADAAINADEFEELEDIADRWSELSPDGHDPKWAYMFALARQNRHGEALEFARAVGLEPVAIANRHLLFAELYMYGIADGPERMRALMELSDHFDRPMELEKAFIVGVLKTETTGRGEDAEVVSRFQEAISTFETRFPEATGLMSIQIDAEDDAATLVEKLSAAQSPAAPEAAEARQDAIDGVRQARLPIAFLAAMVGRSTAEAVMRIGAHPLGVFDATSQEAEVAAAGNALDRAGASWDETACITVAELDDECARRIRAALPGSTIGQSVRDSLNHATRAQVGGEQVAVMHILPDGTPRIIEEDPRTVARIRNVEVAASRLADEIPASAERAVGDDSLVQLFRQQEARDVVSPLRAVTSALLVARQTELPLYSDDRVLRVFARTLELDAFGTLALNEALQQRGLIDAHQAEALLTSVVDLGVWSVPLIPEAYVDAARRVGFDLETCMRPLLADEALLRVDSRILHNARLLAAIAAEAPERLGHWAGAVLESYEVILDADPVLMASLLAAAQFDLTAAAVDDASRTRNVRVIAALRGALGVETGTPDADPLVTGAARWLHSVSDPAERADVLGRLKREVNDDAALILDRLFGVEEGPRSGDHEP